MVIVAAGRWVRSADDVVKDRELQLQGTVVARNKELLFALKNFLELQILESSSILLVSGHSSLFYCVTPTPDSQTIASLKHTTRHKIT